MKRIIAYMVVLSGLTVGLISESADFNGDGTHDIGIFRPLTGLWAIRDVTRAYYGLQGDIPGPADYDGDGCDDICIFRYSNNLWAAKDMFRIYFGASGDTPLISAGGGDIWQHNEDDLILNPLDDVIINSRVSPYPALYVDSTHNAVGIGVASPNECLHIRSSDDPTIRIQSDGTNELSGRISFRQSNNTGADIYYDGTDTTESVMLELFRWGTSVGIPLVVSCRQATLGNIGVKTANPQYDLDVAGSIHVTEEFVCPSADLAEKLEVHPYYELPEREIELRMTGSDLSGDEKRRIVEYGEISLIEPGTVVVITESGIAPCAEENDTRLAGIVSTQPAVKMASDERGQYVALAGKVPCKVTGSVEAGDLLTTSALEGHAEKATNPRIGAVVGKALESFSGSSGLIEVWVGGL